MPTYLKKRARYLFVPNIEKLKRQPKPIKNIRDVIAKTLVAFSEKPNTSEPYIPMYKQIIVTTRMRT